eukprot:2115767-Rhodomonas_salina.3
MLTTEDEGLVAGIRGVEWDAVETPSQFMENWCYDKATIDKMAVHYETGEKIPEELWTKIKVASSSSSSSPRSSSSSASPRSTRSVCDASGAGADVVAAARTRRTSALRA